MDRHADPVTEADFQAYVEDQLSPTRRVEVERFLCLNPDAAMRIITDLRIRDELRLALSEVPSERTVVALDAARRLERALSRDRVLRRALQAAAIIVLVATGWIAHAQFGPLIAGEAVASTVLPAYVADAVRAHRTSLLRAEMHSQRRAPEYDSREIWSATGIVMPSLPSGWTVTDVQVFPSTFGPSVEMAIRSDVFGAMSLFAVRPGTFKVLPATLAEQGDVAAAYWQIGDIAYALVARHDAKELSGAASRLAHTLY
jgi:anti-sigma factor RsiW